MIKGIKCSTTDGYLSSFSQQVPFNIEDNQTLINSYEFNTYHEYIDDVVASLSIYGSAANSFGDDKVRISKVISSIKETKVLKEEKLVLKMEKIMLVEIM